MRADVHLPDGAAAAGRDRRGGCRDAVVQDDLAPYVLSRVVRVVARPYVDEGGRETGSGPRERVRDAVVEPAERLQPCRSRQADVRLVLDQLDGVSEGGELVFDVTQALTLRARSRVFRPASELGDVRRQSLRGDGGDSTLEQVVGREVRHVLRRRRAVVRRPRWRP